MLTQEEFLKIMARLVAQKSDDAEVEAKACSQGLSKDVWESVSAFANTHGGYLFLGVAEKENFNPTEGFDLEKVREQLVDGMGDANAQGAKVGNAPEYKLERFEYKGQQVLVVEVEENPLDKKPCFIASRGVVQGSYKRVDEKDIKLSASELYEIQSVFDASNADKEIVAEATTADLNNELVGGFLESIKTSKAVRGADSVEAKLARVNVINSEGEVRLGGLLALGFYPQQFYPKLIVDVAVHPGLVKASSDVVRFVDRVECEGPLVEVVEDALAAIAKNLRRFSVVEGIGRHDALEIPEEVLREAIVNAVVHREYSEQYRGESVTVDIYPNRVEIRNPGGLWGGKTKETLNDGTSKCRNDSLMKLMKHTPFAGSKDSPAEGEGTGINLMVRSMKEHSLEEPEFDAGFDYFRVILGRSGTEMIENREWIHSVAGGKLTRDGVIDRNRNRVTDEEILRVFETATHPLSMREIAVVTGMKIATARSRIKKLVESGALEPTASTNDRNRKYIIKPVG